VFAQLADGAALAEGVVHMRLAPVLVAVTLSGCHLFMNSMEKPSAEVRDVSLSNAGFTGLTGQLQLDVSNPNGFGVPLSGVEWQLSVGNTRAVSGSAQLQAQIPARGVAPVTTTLTIDARDAIAVGSALASGARTYQLDAKLTFSTKIGPITVDIHHEGTLGQGASRFPSLSQVF
jgi:LEA14-like dessication related protein